MTKSRQALRYLRRSKGKSASERASEFDTVSVADQRTRCEALASREGYEPHREFVDDGLSAYKEGVSRPAFEALWSLIDSGDVDGAVVVADAEDRISRRGGAAALAFRELCAAHSVDIHTDADGFDRTDDENGELPVYIRAWQANKESKAKSRRLVNASTERAHRGDVRNQGVVPFGWSKDDRSKLDPDAAQLVQDAAQAVLRGKPVRSVTRDFNAAGLLTSRGNKWTHSAITALLTRPRNAGLVQLRREVVEGVIGAWEPLWDKETHEALVSMLGDRALTQMTGAGGKRGHSANALLSGIIRCRCGGVMRHQKMTAQASLYRCDDETREGPHTAVKSQDADVVATRALVTVLLFGDADALGADAPDVLALSTLYKRREDIRTQVGRLVDAVKSGALLPGDVAADRADLDRESTELETRVGAVVAANARAGLLADLRRSLWTGPVPTETNALAAVVDQIRERLREMPLDDRRSLLRSCVALTVETGRGTDRIKVTPLVPLDGGVTVDRLAALA